MTIKTKTKIKAWLRGYSDKDIESVTQKLTNPANNTPGIIIPVTTKEFKAYLVMNNGN